MTRGTPDAAARARTITIYTNVQKVIDNLGLAGTDTIAVGGVCRAGARRPKQRLAQARELSALLA